MTQGNYPRDKVAQIQQRLNSAIANIRDDERYTEHARRIEMAKATLSARQERDALKADYLADREKHRDRLQRNLFGLSAAPSHTELVVFRDSWDRAERLESAADAARKLTLARMTGDTYMAKAIAAVAATKAGDDWAEIVNAYVEHEPEARDHLDELREIPSGKRTNLADAAAFNLRVPTELQSFSGAGNLERIADGDTEITVTDPGSKLIQRRSVLTGAGDRDSWER